MFFEHLKDLYRRPRELKAIELLQRPEFYPGLVPWSTYNTRVSFIRLPAFEPYSVWALQCRDKVCQVRRIEWDRAADHELGDAVPESAPATFGADAQLPLDAVQALLGELASVLLPPFLPVGAIGTDGVSSAVLCGDAYRSACLSWWCEPPEGWQPLVRCYERAIALFERHLPVSTARKPHLSTAR